MKFVYLFVFLALAAFCSASPIDDELGEENLKQFEDALIETGKQLVRNKRATCPWFPGACDIHCKSKGFSTGFCRGGTCTCKNH